MNNHIHLLVESPNTEALGNFMCTFKKDSQAIRERYKSPLLTDAKYFKQQNFQFKNSLKIILNFL